MHIRIASAEEIPQIAEWFVANLDVNDAEPASLQHSIIVAAEDESGVVCYIPIKKTILLESLAMCPTASPTRRLRGLAALMNMFKGEKSDIMYMTRGGQRLDELAIMHGFKELPFKVMVKHAD